MAILVTASITLLAVYFNIGKIKGADVAKYTQIRVDSPARVEEIAAIYSDPNIKDKFIDETMRLNTISPSGYINGQTIIIPVFE
ncbi:MAG: hypothetical protein U5N58_09065 [Actinomycetota bacterium]|nr:hypothetical protein [Actinomycetota bacterium]